MDEISTSKLLQHRLVKKDKNCNNHALIDHGEAFERILTSLLDRQLLNPRKQVIDEILDQSKRLF